MKIIALVFLFLLGCQTPKCPEFPEFSDIPAPEFKVLILADTLNPQFEDGTKVKKTWSDTINGQSYHYREGSTRKGDCRISKTPIDTKDGFTFMRMNGVTETCSGVSCEHCAFKDTGGCTCKNIGQGVCTHTISKNRDLLRLR